MCGIAGFIDPRGQWEAAGRLKAMTDAVAHRGPDADGAWINDGGTVALGHRRLSIIDLSAAGSQPMTSPSGRLVLSYNGEIYNHRQLRAELEQCAARHWRGYSDTEVLLAAIEEWGLRKTLQRANGMFALALWDCERRVLSLARDRFGEKPLFYGRSGGSFLFGSELKALTTWPSFERTVDRSALAAYFRLGYVPAPRSIWRNISKLPPGHYLDVDSDGQVIGRPRAYYDLSRIVAEGARAPIAAGPDAVDALERLLSAAVGMRMEADVPLGAFLSGGIDSSLIVALMQKHSSRPVRSFTIGFEESGYDEAHHARAVAAHLGTDHQELYVSSSKALDLVPRLPDIWDEPLADPSQIPTFLVSEMTRRHVTVCLSGDGGDELFGGYERYQLADRIWRSIARLPAPARPAGANALRLTGGALTHMRAGHALRGDRLLKLAELFRESSGNAVERKLMSIFPEPPLADAPASAGYNEPDMPGALDDMQRMMHRDMRLYLPDDILAKVDRASMAVSLETRVPFLDPSIVSFAWQLPTSAKVAGGSGKIILRQILARHLPPALFERPKKGFSVPVEDWLRGPLRPWAEDLLDARSLAEDGLLDGPRIRRLWSEHLSGRRRWHTQLWSVLMFQAWRQRHCAAGASALTRVLVH